MEERPVAIVTKTERNALEVVGEIQLIQPKADVRYMDAVIQLSIAGALELAERLKAEASIACATVQMLNADRT